MLRGYRRRLVLRNSPIESLDHGLQARVALPGTQPSSQTDGCSSHKMQAVNHRVEDLLDRLCYCVALAYESRPYEITRQRAVRPTHRQR